jgi:hypothetical protein
VEVLKSGLNTGWPNSVSPDGRLLAYTEFNEKTGADIKVLSLVGERISEPFLATPSEEWNPMISPDGNWIAYSSNESGPFEVYVTRFPGAGSKTLISDEGGDAPRWSRDGRELYYRNRRKTMVVEVDTKQAFQASRPKMLFEGDFPSPGASAQYDVSPDGKRFLVMKGESRKPARKINVIVNWQDELRQKMEKKE